MIDFVFSLFSLQLDDWVLCRIYQKANVSSSMSTASPSDLEQEEEEQFIQDTLLPILRSPPTPNNIHNTLKPQKSASFSNLLDAMDYSMLGSFLSDNQTNRTGFESAPYFTSGFLDDHFGFDNGTDSSTNYYPNPENKLKRPNSSVDENPSLPSKKSVNSCSFTNDISNGISTDQSDPQYNFLQQSFLNQQLLLSPHVQFLGQMN